MISLLLTMFLLVIGLGLLYYLERDGHASIGMQRSHRAQVIALAGLNYARLQEMAYQRDVPTPPDPFPPGAPAQTFNLDGAGTERFRIWKESLNGQPIHCQGQILDSSARVLAVRELEAYTLNPTTGAVWATYMGTQFWDVDL
ncbi:hypothetical protein JST97_38320 [bacterium]|nr:hypothetical protein [bacterium]